MIWKRVQEKIFLDEFVSAFYLAGKEKIPMEYLTNPKNEVWALFLDGKIIGGFAIINQKPFRTIDQIMNMVGSYRDTLQKYDTSEITCYFSSNKKYNWKVRLKLLKRCLLSFNRYFVYSYNVDKKRLENYYKLGDPFRVYSGRMLNDNGKITIENVEIINKIGIIKIFLKTIIKRFRG